MSHWRELRRELLVPCLWIAELGRDGIPKPQNPKTPARIVVNFKRLNQYQQMSHWRELRRELLVPCLWIAELGRDGITI